MDVNLTPLTHHALVALDQGDLAAAERAVGWPLPGFFLEPQFAFLWRRRREQVEADPGELTWITRLILDPAGARVVGHAGFHGPPDEEGLVEVGYSVEPSCRRRGFARAALEALCRRAADEPRVRRVRASISPDNSASRDLVLSLGFVVVGEQVDELDGLELVYERPA